MPCRIRSGVRVNTNHMPFPTMHPDDKYVKAGSISGLLAHSPKPRLNIRPSL
jgi:hypothetical protein